MIYLIRHGETWWNLQGRKQGHADSPLTDRGLNQAKAAGNRLRDELIAPNGIRLMSSPLGRARTTASIIATCLGFDSTHVEVDPLLMEYGYGNWEGLTDAEIRQTYPEARKARSADKWNYVIHGGESYAQLWSRAVAWLAKVSEDSHAVAVTHMKINRMIMAAYSGLPPEAMLAMGRHHNTIYRLHEQQITTIDCG